MRNSPARLPISPINSFKLVTSLNCKSFASAKCSCAQSIFRFSAGRRLARTVVDLVSATKYTRSSFSSTTAQSGL